jgi:hypothetical protein
MRSIKIAGASAVIVAAVSALLASASYADAPGLFAKEMAVLTDQGISPARALQALDVQGKVARADLPSKVETAMGGAFAGVWFEPAAARLHIGATSPASRRAAEGATERAGLAADVTVTPVRSTMAQLLVTQKQWNRKLARLFAREQVETGLEPQRNAVSVTLSSSVSPSQRTALEREAAAASVNVFVTVAEGNQLSLVPQAKTKCKKWARFEGYCDPSLTSGVTILKAKKPECTAGPLAINKKKERVVLTAGHCIEKVGEAWSAINTKSVESVVGPVEAFVFGGAKEEKRGDYGDILIEPAWQTGKPAIPVFAVTAEWIKMNEKKEETSYPVKGERLPVVKNTNCHVGQVSGESCGEIKTLNVTLITGGKFVEGLVEDAGANLIGEGGDSGGPWLFIEPNQEALMEGTHTGFVPECVKVAKQKGPQFFKTQAECFSLEFKEKEGNEGEWERKEYKCKKVAKVEKGAKFYKTEEECKKLEKAGEGEFERTPEMHLIYQPLKQPVKEAPEGSLENLKLELLTTANEIIELPVILNSKKEVAGVVKFTDTKNETKLVGLSGTEVKCTGGSSEGETEAKKPLGLFHIKYTGCTGPLGVACTGLGDKEKEILMLGTFHIVYDTITPTLGAAILFLLETAHFSCLATLVQVKGEVLCLISPINSLVKTAKVVCEQEKGDPKEVQYWNDKGEEVNIKEGLLVSENEKAFEMAGLGGESEITLSEEVELMA